MEYFKGNINEPETNCNIKNIRDLYGDISQFKMGYEPSTDLEKWSACVFARCYEYVEEKLVTYWMYLGFVISGRPK